jgi:hypothetical protein
MPAHGRALTEDHVSRKDNPFRGHVNNRVPDPVAWPDVNHVNLQAFEIQHESFVEQRRRKRRLDPGEAVILVELPAGGLHARVGGVERLREHAADAVRQRLIPVGSAACIMRSGTVRCAIISASAKDLVTPNMVAAFVGIDHALRPVRAPTSRTAQPSDARGTGRLRVDRTPPPRLMNPEFEVA